MDDMREMEDKDIYELYPYQTYNYVDNALTKIHNNMINNNKKGLLLKDSFGNTVAPFLSLCFEEVVVIDLRLFDGSIKEYIINDKPDYIVVLYSAAEYKNEIPNNHHDLFDFR